MREIIFDTAFGKYATPLTVQYTDLSRNVSIWKWNFGNEINYVQQIQMHTNSAAGIYTVNLTVIKANCTNSKLEAINVSAQPVLPLTNFSSNITQGNAPLSVLFIDQSKNTTGSNRYFVDETNTCNSLSDLTKHVYA
jgi:PKD repeat protein